MHPKPLTVVLSQASGENPSQRAFEESLATILGQQPGLSVTVIPHLVDLGPQHAGVQFLKSVSGELVLLSWLYPRAAFWLLDYAGVAGHPGTCPPSTAVPQPEEARVSNSKGTGNLRQREIPDRFIYCLDLRSFPDPQACLDEVHRIRETSGQGLQSSVEIAEKPFSPEQLLQKPVRRWFPLIDYSRCTNCLECIDFCLFGVYGTDRLDCIVVESPDSCKRGCPACSRVCPEQAIMFPDHKTPAIAGSSEGPISGLKLDLTQLFGGMEAQQQAVLERERAILQKDQPRGESADKTSSPALSGTPCSKDELDKLMDAVEEKGP
jgi:ferredoxin